MFGEITKTGNQNYVKLDRNMHMHIIEGEAPETDDESEVNDLSPSRTYDAAPKDSSTISEQNQAHVDEKLKQCWRRLGEDVLIASVQRVQPTMKIINNMEACLDSTLTTVQDASFHIRHASNMVCQLEDSVDALLDAAKLIPRFENTMDVEKVVKVENIQFGGKVLFVKPSSATKTCTF